MDDFPVCEENENGFEIHDDKESSESDADDIVSPIGYKLCRSAKAENKMFKLISKVQEMYGFSQDQAIFILHYFKWNSDKIGEGLFISDEKDKEIKIAAGIALIKSPYKDRCPICSIKFTSTKSPLELPCGHRACLDCFKDYIGYNIEDKRCVNLQCWECKAFQMNTLRNTQNG
jgi:ariadne-1